MRNPGERDPSRLKEVARALGFDTVGVCEPAEPPHYGAYARWIAQDRHGSMTYLERHLEPKRDPRLLLPGARSIVAVSLNYFQTEPGAPGGPKIARYALGRDYHKVVRGKLNHLARWIETDVPGARCRVCVDSAPVMERDYAQQAGLGWFGKNTMLIDSRLGSWFFIGVLLTTAEYARDEPSVGGCGTCTACIDACPTGALVMEDGRWQVDARRCISYLTIEHDGEHAQDTAGWLFGCDVCQEVCPFNAPRASQPLRARTTTEPDFLQCRSWPDVASIAEIDEQDWDRLTRGSPLRRPGLLNLRRNARIVMARGSGMKGSEHSALDQRERDQITAGDGNATEGDGERKSEDGHTVPAGEAVLADHALRRPVG